MTCPKCGSENVNAQMVTETQLKKQHHNILWWICVSWWWLPVKWIMLTIPAIIMKIFAPKKYKTKVTHKSMWVCQNCGHHWEA